MKKWTAFWVFLVLLILGSFYGMGFIVEHTLNKNVNALPENSVIKAHLDNYRRGWFSSQAVFGLDIHVPAQQTTDKNGLAKTSPPFDVTFNIPLIMKHGPVICANSGIRFGIGQVTTQPQTHYGMFINYLNRSVFSYALPSFSIQGNAAPNEGAFQLDWKGLRTLLSVSSDIDNIEGDLKLFGLSASANKAELTLGEVNGDFDLNKEEGLWLGQTHFLIPSVAMSMDSQQIFDLKGFDLLLGAEIVEKSLNINYKFSLNKLFLNNKTYGPGNVVLHIKNLDPAVMAKINQLQFSMIQTNGNSSLPMLTLLAEVPKLFSKGSELDFSETFDVPEGKIVGNLKMSLPKNESNDLGQLMQKAQGEGQFKAPIAFVKDLMVMSVKSDIAKSEIQSTSSTTSQESLPSTTPNPAPEVDIDTRAQTQADAQLQNLVSKGILKVEGNDYVIHFKLENQQFMVNGQPFDPNSLQ